jgi:valyl-tRNA synthetase
MEDFYPNDLRETGYDILFFWVAREMMLGVELTGELPYKNIYFHGLVRNEHGAKISKSMENIEEYDPLNIIDEQGADTLRYTLIAYSSPGLDMNLDPKYLDGTHKFGNKLWQMVRYVLGNIPDDFEYQDPAAMDIASLEFSDQWMLSALNSLIIHVTQFYDQYNFLEAARELRRFAWNVFADWYIEITKIRIYDESYSGFDPRNMLLYVIEALVRLLHPIMPFMTEKLWSHLPQELREHEALIITPWPQARTELVDNRIESDFILLQEIITAIRGIRGEFTVPPSKQIAAIISAGEKFDVFDRTKAEIANLAGIDPTSLEIHEEINPEGKLISTVTEGISVFIPLEGLVEIDDEIKRIEKEIEEIDSRIKKSEGKLNSEFANRAPANIVEEEKDRLAALQADKAKLEERKQVLIA